MSDLSAYELERLSNIENNKAKLIELGIEDAAAQIRKPASRKRAREPKTHIAPTRASGRLSGEVADKSSIGTDALDMLDALEEKIRSGLEPLKRASTAPRLTSEQITKLDALEPSSAGPLNDLELKALELARDDLVNERTEGGWQAHKKKGTSMWGEKRTILRGARRHGLRWPSWLDKIQDALPPMGTTESARDQTMYAIERAACGLGLDYKAWPDGVGVLLANDEPLSLGPNLYTALDIKRIITEQGSIEEVTGATVRKALERELAVEAGALKPFKEDISKKIDVALAALDSETPHNPRIASPPVLRPFSEMAASAAPRVLTLGSDTEALRREGQRLEAKFGRDAGNGWAYNHALNKLRAYQTKLLSELFDEAPSAPSIRDQEEAEEA